MADELEPRPLPVPSRSDESQLTSSSRPDSLTFGSPNQLAELDVNKLELLFDLQEKQRESDFQRDLKFKELDLKARKQEAERIEKEKKNAQQLEIQKVETYFKMFIAVTALAIGTAFVITGHPDVGYFMLGGAMSMVTSGIVGIMKAAREAQHGK